MDAAITHKQGAANLLPPRPQGAPWCLLLSSHGAPLLVVREPPADTPGPRVSSAPAVLACQAQPISHKRFPDC